MHNIAVRYRSKVIHISWVLNLKHQSNSSSIDTLRKSKMIKEILDCSYEIHPNNNPTFFKEKKR